MTPGALRISTHQGPHSYVSYMIGHMIMPYSMSRSMPFANKKAEIHDFEVTGAGSLGTLWRIWHFW